MVRGGACSWCRKDDSASLGGQRLRHNVPLLHGVANERLTSAPPTGESQGRFSGVIVDTQTRRLSNVCCAALPQQGSKSLNTMAVKMPFISSEFNDFF